MNRSNPTINGGALAGHRYRVIVSTDIGGAGPDDFQSMVHFLLYADNFDIEGLVSSSGMGGPGRKQDIFDIIDCYEQDYENLKKYSDKYPTPDALRAMTKQSETEFVPYPGVQSATEGSEWIVKCARRDDPRPLYILGWGGIEDIAQALKVDGKAKDDHSGLIQFYEKLANIKARKQQKRITDSGIEDCNDPYPSID